MIGACVKTIYTHCSSQSTPPMQGQLARPIIAH
jgi:hypothetical protein